MGNGGIKKWRAFATVRTVFSVAAWFSALRAAVFGVQR
jgi:hypothetical protein